MSEREPITGELREAIEWEPTFCGPDRAMVPQPEFDSLCDAIDAAHAGLERENAELRQRVAELDKRDDSMHDGGSITDELRRFIEDPLLGYAPQDQHIEILTEIADRIDAEHEAKVSYWQGASYKDGYDEGFASADDWLGQHEDAMAEHGWVRGPLDADGKMWRSGDMSDSNWGVIEGIAYEDGRWLISGHDTSAPWVPADSIRHYHEATVEDVLTEFGIDWEHESDCEDRAALLKEYAKRLTLAGDAE